MTMVRTEKSFSECGIMNGIEFHEFFLGGGGGYVCEQTQLF